MAPQPLSTIKSSGNYIFGNDVLTNNPELGSLVSRAIAGWAIIEAHLGHAFATLVGPKQNAALSMYFALRSFEIQRTLLETLIDEKLPKRTRRILRATIAVICREASTRHKFAHYIWGRSTDPGLSTEALFLVEPKYLWQLRVRRLAHAKKYHRKPNPMALISYPWLNRAIVSVWRKTDLEEACEKMEIAFGYASVLERVISLKGQQRTRAQRLLTQIPEIRSQLRRMFPTGKRRPHSSQKSRHKSPGAKRARRKAIKRP